MRASIRDKEALRSVSLLDLASYLRAVGWQESTEQFERFALWRRDDESGEAQEIILPRDPDAGDFIARVADAIATLEEVETRSQLEIIQDLNYATVDLVRIQRPTPDSGDGSISIDDGVQLVESARQLVIAAACATVTPRRVIAPRRPAQAIDYLRTVRLGQTERGSYIVTLISRVAPLLTPGQPALLELMSEPFPRRTMRVLTDAVAATIRASNEAAASGSFSAFEEAVEFGVSANLCEAIVGLAAGGIGGDPISVSTYWAASRPHVDNPHPQTQLTEPAIPIIAEAARIFRESEPLEDALVVGPVVNLHRDQGSSSGVATIACILEGKPRHVSLTLSDVDYEIAIQAHREEKAVTFLANVDREGRTFHAENVRDLKVLREE